MSKPRIIVFACAWCSSAAADLAGTTRLAMTADFTVLRVMCSGRVDPVHILHALALGADGVLVTGCHPGDCHYGTGNVHARKRVDFTRTVLGALGLAERVQMVAISASEGRRFQQVLATFDDELTQLGPSPIRGKLPRPTDAKRDGLLVLLRGMAEALGVVIPEGLPIPPEQLPRGFGAPAFDVDSCMGCGACFQACPTGNIQLEDKERTRTISHFHARCVACKACERACPTESIAVHSQLELGALVSDRLVQGPRFPLRGCPICGTPTIPERQHVYLVQQLEQDGGPHDAPDLCEPCRRRATGRDLMSQLISMPMGDLGGGP